MLSKVFVNIKTVKQNYCTQCLYWLNFFLLSLYGDVPRATSYRVYISQLIRFAWASSHVVDFNTCNKILAQNFLEQGFWYHKLRKTFSKFYRRYYDLISKFHAGLSLSWAKDFLNLGFMLTWCISWIILLALIIFQRSLLKIISHYKKIGFNPYVLQKTACLVVNPI